MHMGVPHDNAHMGSMFDAAIDLDVDGVTEKTVHLNGNVLQHGVNLLFGLRTCQ
jgi:hypothetical protein